MNTELSAEVNNVYRAQPIFNNSPTPVWDHATGQYISSKVSRFIADEYIRDVKNNKRSIEEFYKELSKLDVNDTKSLLYVKNNLQGRSWENISFDSDDYTNLLIVYLKGFVDPFQAFNNLISNKIHYLLPAEYVAWFENDLRCSLFLAHLIQHVIVQDAYKGRRELLAVVTEFLRFNIYMFNNEYLKNMPKYSLRYSRVGEQKTIDILLVKSKYMKNRLEDFDWIDPENDQMIDWIYKYLSRKGHEHIILKGIFFPENTQEKYELILASLDVLSNIEDPSIGTKNKKGFSRRAYVLLSMEKAWRGRKQYANDNLSSDNDSVKIYKNNIPKLKKLMAYNDLSLKQIVNKSIEQMYDQLIANNSDTLDKDDASG